MKIQPLKILNTMLLLLLIMLMPLEGSTKAQQRLTRGGHALDANLKLGSGGYNRSRAHAPKGMQRNRYSAGSSRALYTVNRRGTMNYNPHNAFAPRSRYKSTGYTGDTYSNNYHRRFRYERSSRRH